MGPSGSGQVAKSCKQTIVTNTIAVWAEVLEYAASQRLDLANLIESLAHSTADSSIRQAFAQDLALGRFPDLSSRNMIKELEIITDRAGKAHVGMPHGELTLKAFRSGIAGRFDK